MIANTIGATNWGQAAATLVVVVCGVLAMAKAETVTFNPFLYFRF